MPPRAYKLFPYGQSGSILIKWYSHVHILSIKNSNNFSTFLKSRTPQQADGVSSLQRSNKNRYTKRKAIADDKSISSAAWLFCPNTLYSVPTSLPVSVPAPASVPVPDPDSVPVPDPVSVSVPDPDSVPVPSVPASSS